jgi:hypothetical protein
MREEFEKRKKEFIKNPLDASRKGYRTLGSFKKRVDF